LIYLDNAATTYPKPPAVVDAVTRFLTEIGGNPARSGHRLAVAASRAVHDARERMAGLVGLDDPMRVIFTANCTTGINLAVHGLLSPGSHVVTSSVEHNSVMRPLRALERCGVGLTVVPCNQEGYVSPNDTGKAIRPNTVMVVVQHASNVLGSIQPIRDIGRICRERDVLFLVDAAQTLGVVPVDLEEDCIDLLAFSGHKALYGPQGTGGLILGKRVNASDVKPLTYGGTGSSSESERQPVSLPDALESGTLNGPGIAGLGAGVEFVLSEGLDRIREREMELTARLISGLEGIDGVTLRGPRDCSGRVAVVSFSIRGKDPAMVAFRLDEEHGIMCRAGLHCAPAAHRTAGTFPKGSVRFGIGCFQTEADIDAALSALEEISGGG
jgi:cysteine desulfurase family protein